MKTWPSVLWTAFFEYRVHHAVVFATLMVLIQGVIPDEGVLLALEEVEGQGAAPG